MNRLFRSLAVFACLAAAAIASTVGTAIVATARAARDWVIDWGIAAVQVFKPPKDWRDLDRPAVSFVAARAFVMRLAKRARPITTPGWRMCPST